MILTVTGKEEHNVNPLLIPAKKSFLLYNGIRKIVNNPTLRKESVYSQPIK